VKILVTGVSGNLGAEVGRRLIEEGHQVIGVVNRSHRLMGNCRQPLETETFSANPSNSKAIRTLQWDMRKPLSLPPDELRFILQNVDTVVHSAAVTDFGLQRDVYQQSNVDGTHHLVQLIRQFGPRPIHLVHVSTAYVSGTVRGIYKEADLDRGQGFSNFYEESKYMAEQLLRAHTSQNATISVVRPSIIVGESIRGRIRDFKHLYPLLKIVGAGQITSVAGYYDSSINVVPIDYVVEGIVALATKKPADGGRTYHAVSEKNITMRELSDVLAEFPAIHVPRVLPPSTFYGGTRNQSGVKLYDRVVKKFECYFSKWAGFEKEAMRGLLPSTNIPPSADLIRNLVRFGEADGYLS
jgi:nucleoside-diphosphate-sugar epimerase